MADGWLRLPVEEAYEHLPSKVYWFIRYAVDNLSFQYLFKVDDNVYADPTQLVHAPSGDYCGAITSGGCRTYHFGKCQNQALNTTPYQGDFTGPFCNGGAGYFLSRRACEVIADPQHEPFFQSELYEDKAVGDILRDAGITPIEIQGMCRSSSMAKRLGTKRPITVHTRDLRTAIRYFAAHHVRNGTETYNRLSARRTRSE